MWHSKVSLCVSFQIFCRGTERNLDLSWMELKKEVTLAVESEVRFDYRKKDNFFHLTVGQIGTKKLFKLFIGPCC